MSNLKQQYHAKVKGSRAPATGLSPEQRRKENMQSNEEYSHVTGGSSREHGFTPASELNGMSPEDRASDRGADYRQGLASSRNPNDAYRSIDDKSRQAAIRDLADKKESTTNSGFDQSESRVAYDTVYGKRNPRPEERKSGPAMGKEIRTTTWKA